MILDFNEKGFLKFKQGRFKLQDFGLFEKKKFHCGQQKQHQQLQEEHQQQQRRF